MTIKIRRLSLFTFYNDDKDVYVIWNNREEALKYVVDNKLFSNEIFKHKKEPINSKILVSIDCGKNYIYLNRALKNLDGKLSEPYIFNSKYVVIR